MKFHTETFLTECCRRLPEGVGATRHHDILYVASFFPLRVEFLQDTIARACEKSAGTPEATLEETPLRIHLHTLLRTLRGTRTYIQSHKGLHRIAGEERTRYDYHINLHTIAALFIEARDKADGYLLTDIIRDEQFISIRKAQALLDMQYGQMYSKQRVNRALHILEEQGLIKSNGHIRLRGREVLR